jgi:hypothetical protein
MVSSTVQNHAITLADSVEVLGGTGIRPQVQEAPQRLRDAVARELGEQQWPVKPPTIPGQNMWKFRLSMS